MPAAWVKLTAVLREQIQPYADMAVGGGKAGVLRRLSSHFFVLCFLIIHPSSAFLQGSPNCIYFYE